jgi:hypothetical protein
MVTLEQIKLLESKITRAIDIVTRLNEENLRLKKRNEELEELAEKLKSEKTRIEEGIVSALDRLNQFEDAIERSLDSVKGAKARELPPQQPVRPEGRLPEEGRLLKEDIVSGESRPSDTFRKPAGPEQPAAVQAQPVTAQAASAQPAVTAQTGRIPARSGPEPVRPEPAIPQAYLIDEEEAESAEEENEDTGEAELDIF